MKPKHKLTKSNRSFISVKRLFTHALNRDILLLELDRTERSPKTSPLIIQKKPRNRTSKLDPYFPTIASFISQRTSAKSSNNDISQYTLQNLAEKIKIQNGLVISRSALSRYISRHTALKGIYK